MQAGLVVGLGGFIGAVLRYEMGRIPLTSSFPLMTLVINVIGAFVSACYDFGYGSGEVTSCLNKNISPGTRP